MALPRRRAARGNGVMPSRLSDLRHVRLFFLPGALGRFACARALLPGGVPKTRDLPGSALSWPSFLPIREDSVSIDAAYLPAEGRYVVLFVRQRSPVWRAVEGHAANRTARGEG